MSAPLSVGDRVRLASAPPYLKTADTMPMLRPGDIVSVSSQGVILQQKPNSYWVVKFDQGTFLVDGTYLEKASSATQTAEEAP